jgi:hypothetical protein
MVQLAAERPGLGGPDRGTRMERGEKHPGAVAPIGVGQTGTPSQGVATVRTRTIPARRQVRSLPAVFGRSGQVPGAARSGRSSCWQAQNGKASGEKPLRGMPFRPRQTRRIRSGWVKLLGLRSLQPPLGRQPGAAPPPRLMSYNLARLGINALIERREHTATHDLTPHGQRVAVLYTKVQDRLLRPLIGADQPQHPPSYALTTTDQRVHAQADHARLGQAA